MWAWHDHQPQAHFLLLECSLPFLNLPFSMRQRIVTLDSRFPLALAAHNRTCRKVGPLSSAGRLEVSATGPRPGSFSGSMYHDQAVLNSGK